jgi:hypothetical protein
LLVDNEPSLRSSLLDCLSNCDGAGNMEIDPTNRVDYCSNSIDRHHHFRSVHRSELLIENLYFGILMLKHIVNFLIQPYTNVLYCVLYQFRWNNNASPSFAKKLSVGIDDAWRTSNNQYLYGSQQ